MNELKAILDISDTKAKSLLELSNNNFDNAIDLYLNEINKNDIFCKSKHFDNIEILVNKSKKSKIHVNSETFVNQYKNPKINIENMNFTIEMLNYSLFDNNISKSFNLNLNYMRKIYGFTIPYIDYVVDINSIFYVVWQKINIKYRCIFCNKCFMSKQSCQHHMIDTNHCKIHLDLNYHELSLFYNFNDMNNNLILHENINKTNELILPNGNKLIHRTKHKKYKLSHIFNKKSNDLYSKYLIKNKQKKEWKILKKGMIYNKKAIPSQFIHKDFNTLNKKRQANLHHWGNGGGGSHFHMSAPKQFLKGLRISGIKQRRGGRSFKNAQNAKQTTKLL